MYKNNSIDMQKIPTLILEKQNNTKRYEAGKGQSPKQKPLESLDQLGQTK
jgi:hypothetical protein